MKSIIIGDGKVGNALAENLCQDEDNDVTIVDRDQDPLTSAIENLDVRCIRGNGLRASVLIEAGVRDADLLIAATSSDEINMVCSLMAKRLGAAHAIARIRDPEYADDLAELQADLGFDMVINPEQAVATEIARLLEFPSARNVVEFANGRVQMVEIKVAPDMAMAGMTMKELAKKSPHILVGAIAREGGEVVIPTGEDRAMAGDSAYLIGPPSKVYRFCYRAGMHMQRVRSVMVVGGGRIAYYLARHLIDADIKLKIVEISHERCVELSEALPEALVIHGDGSDDRLLASESLAEMDCFVSLTGMDEENLMTGLLAKRAGVPKVVVKINRAGYTEVIQGLGIDNIIRTRGITANTILRYVRSIKNALGNPVNSLYRVIEGRLEAIEFTASRASPVLGVPLRKLRVARGILVGVIVRQNEIIIPHGNDEILLGDRVILITEGMELNDLSDILASGGGVVT